MFTETDQSVEMFIPKRFLALILQLPSSGSKNLQKKVFS